MMNPENLVDPEVKRKLEAFRSTPSRDPQAAARGKAAFLAQARAMSVDEASAARRLLAARPQVVPLNRNPFAGLRRLGQLALVFFALVVALLSGWVGVLAAENSAPGQALYPLKVLGEEVQIALTGSSSVEQVALGHQFVQRRMDEAVPALISGRDLPETFFVRWEGQMDGVLQSIAGLDEANVVAALQNTRQLWQAQLQEMQMLHTQGETPTWLRVRSSYTARLGWVEDGVTNPANFRHQFGPPLQQPSVTQADGQPSATPKMQTTPSVDPNVDGHGPLATPSTGGYGPHGPLAPTRTPGAGYGSSPTPQPPHGAPTSAGTPAGNGPGAPAHTAQPDDPPGGGDGNPGGVDNGAPGGDSGGADSGGGGADSGGGSGGGGSGSGGK